MKKQTKQSSKAPLVIGAAVIASLAGAYFLYGSKDAVKNRKHVKGWIIKAKGEVVEKLEKAKLETQDEYNALIDAALKKYAAVKSIDTTEVEALGKDLKRHWRAFQKELKNVKKS